MGVLAAILKGAPVVIALSTITWVIMYYMFPDAPLTAADTALVVFVFTLLTAAVQGLLKRRKGRGREREDPSTEDEDQSAEKEDQSAE